MLIVQQLEYYLTAILALFYLNTICVDLNVLPSGVLMPFLISEKKKKKSVVHFFLARRKHLQSKLFLLYLV